MVTNLYRKNIRQWEQWSRVALGVPLGLAAFAVSNFVVQIALVVIGLVLAATGIIGWCPACATFGRRLGTK